MYGQNYPGLGDIISTPRGKFVRAPERPFPWWGPFDGVNALGRSVLLFGLIGMAVIFLALLTLQEEMPDTFSFTTVLGVIITLLYIVSGIGILLRRRWGVWILKILIVGFILLILYWLYLILNELPPSTSFWSLEAAKVFGLLLPSIAAALVFICTFLISLWTYWSKPSVRYEFGYVRVSDLKHGMHETTRQFGLAAGMIGVAFGLYAIQYVLVFLFLPIPGQGIAIAIIFGLIITLFLIISLLMAIAGLTFRERLNGGRIILLVMSIFGFVVIGIYFVLILAVLGFVPAAMGYMPVLHIARGGVAIIVFLAFGYMLIEIMRYLICPKAKAWCRAGKYMPPWIEQIRLAESLEEDPPEESIKYEV